MPDTRTAAEEERIQDILREFAVDREATSETEAVLHLARALARTEALATPATGTEGLTVEAIARAMALVHTRPTPTMDDDETWRSWESEAAELLAALGTPR